MPEGILDSKRRIFANKENFGKENSLHRKFFAKKRNAKKAIKNIGNKSLILYLFRRKIANIMNEIFQKIVTKNYNKNWENIPNRVF